MDAVNWSLESETTRLGMTRIAALHEVLLTSMNVRYEIVQLNDGAVMAQDIPSESPTNAVQEFLALVDLTFEIAALTDQRLGGSGVRGVVTLGARYNLRGNLGWISADSNPRNPSFFCPRPVMMNTAFGRAYGVESSHSLPKRSGLYVELAVLTKHKPAVCETWSQRALIEIPGFGPFLQVRDRISSNGV